MTDTQMLAAETQVLAVDRLDGGARVAGRKIGLTSAPGQLILAGAATAATPFAGSRVEARIAQLGVVTVQGAAS